MKANKRLLAAMAAASLAIGGCNADITWGSLSFHYVHIKMYGDDAPTHLKVDSWKGDEGGIEIKTKDHGTILLGDGTYMMYDVEACPICGEVEYK